MELTERIWLLMARALNREASHEEMAELSELLRSDVSLQQQYELLTRIWQERQYPQADHQEESATISRIINKANQIESNTIAWPVRQRRRRSRRVLVALLLVAILITAGVTIWPITRTASATAVNIPDELIARKGSRIRSLLPDGTTVWLNAGSKLVFVNDFSGLTREVRLEGEAYFDVVKQPARPFIVHVPGYHINVLGTVFNVKSYPEEKFIETTLLHGRVQVTREAGPVTEAIELRPSYKLILPAIAVGSDDMAEEKPVTTKAGEKNRFVLTAIDTTKKENELIETAWLYSRLEFRGDSFEQLARKMERWYNVRIVFTDDTVKRLHFNGSFERETVEQAFKALLAAVPYFKYQITPDEIFVGTPE